MTIGSRHWAIAEGYIPSPGSEDDSRFESHETACLLNTNDVEAHVTITLYFSASQAYVFDASEKLALAPRK